MRIGQLNKRIKIQKRIERQNDLKEMLISFVDWQDVWASIEPLTGREYFAAQQISSDISTRIVIRDLPGVTEKMRIVYAKRNTDVRIYEIDSVLPTKEDNRTMALMCRKINSEGFRVDGSRG